MKIFNTIWYWFLIIIAIGSSGAAIFFGYKIYCAFDLLPNNSDNSYNTIGVNTLYLITTPILTVAIVIVTYLAFLMQKKANDLIINEQQRKKIEDQFYTMLDLHRKNVDGLVYRRKNSDDIIGKQFFSLIKKDFHAIYDFTNKRFPKHSSKEKIQLAYELLFNGSQEYEFKIHNFSYDKEFSNEINKAFEILQPQNTEIAVYIRHLYQTVKFIANQNEKDGLITYNDKREYLRVLRAQLSTDEQIMLFYNWFSGFGSQWEQSSKDELHIKIEKEITSNINFYKTALKTAKENKKYKRTYHQNLECLENTSIKLAALARLMLENKQKGSLFRFSLLNRILLCYGEKKIFKQKNKTNSENYFFTDYRMIHNIFPELMLNDIKEDLKKGNIIDFTNKTIRKEKNRESDPVFEFQEW